MCEHCTRREFLGTGVAAGGLMLAGAAWTHAWTSERRPNRREIADLRPLQRQPRPG